MSTSRVGGSVVSRRRVGGKSLFEGRVGRGPVRAVAIAAILFLAAAGANASDWLTETIGWAGDVDNGIDIVANDPNTVHLYYGAPYGSYDTYALRDPTGWMYYSMNWCVTCDMDVDPGNRARLLTTDRPSGIYTATYWQHQESVSWYYWPDLASNVSAGNAELKINSSGTAMLGYIDRPAQTLMYAEIQGDLWGSPSYYTEIAATSSAFDTAQPLVDMVLDRDQQPCFLWYESSAEQLKWARRSTAGSWNVQTIRTGEMLMGFAAAFDANNDLHVAFSNWGSTAMQVRHSVYNGTTWQDRLVDADADQVGSLVIDSQNQPHLAYFNFNSGSGLDAAKYATFYGNQWHAETVMDVPHDGSQGYEEVVMDVDAADHLHMAFRGDASQVYYARLDEVPRPVPTEEKIVLAARDAEANYSSSLGFIVSDGAWSVGVQKTTSGTDRRGLIEFDTAVLHPGVDVVSAQLRLDISMRTGTSTTGPEPSVYAFVGDGQLTPSDATKTQTLVGTSEPILALGIHLIDLDPAAIESLLRQHSSLGLLLVGTTSGLSFDTVENYYSDEAALVLQVTPTPVTGDANRDGTVNADDAALLAEHWGTSGNGWDEGDFNGDSVVNAADASILAANWGRTTAEGQGTVPEPAAIVLLVTATAAALGIRRRHS